MAVARRAPRPSSLPRAGGGQPAAAPAPTAEADKATAAAAAAAASNGAGVAVEEEHKGGDGSEGEETKSDDYTQEMQAKMGTSLTYRHELGLNFNRILPDLIVGSCLQTPADVDRLAEEEGVRVVFCLQEDSDMAYFDLDVSAIQARCAERGDIKHVRFPIRDFDPYDLRRKLPKAVTRLAREHDPSLGTVYIHCTAGLGRAPATAVAYMAWIRGMPIDEAVELTTSKRTCSPKVESIRSAMADLLLGLGPVPATVALYRQGAAESVQVAGLDVGWHQQLDMEWDPRTHRYVLQRAMYPGKYPFKFIVDGHWTYSIDHQTVQDGSHINNCLEVLSKMDAESSAKQLRYLSKGCVLSEEEQGELQAMLCPWASHDVTLGRTGGLQKMLDEVEEQRKRAEFGDPQGED